jgi:hypothetical protein
MFLWVALVFEVLDKEDRDLDLVVHGSEALEIVEEIPLALSNLYDYIITRIMKKRKDLQYYKNVLVVITLARRPLSLRELAVLAGLRPKIKPRTIVKKCGSFLTTEKDTVYLIHQTAKEWLENALVLDDNHNSRLQTGGTIQGHADISRRSIDAISKLQNNIYSLHPGSKLGDITIPSPDPLEGL